MVAFEYSFGQLTEMQEFTEMWETNSQGAPTCQRSSRRRVANISSTDS